MFRGDLDGFPIQDVTLAARGLDAENKPAPAELQNATRIMVPAGPMPARAVVLMLRSDVTAAGFNINAQHTLHLEFDWSDVAGSASDDTLDSLDFNNLVVTREPIALTPSYVADAADSLMLVELADMRWMCHNQYFHQSIDAQYNVRAPAYVGAEQFNADAGTAITPLPADCYYRQSLDLTDPTKPVTWTWATMLQDMWENHLTILGDFPGLPDEITDDKYGTPEGYVFLGVSAWLAINDVLTRLGCMIAPDLSETDVGSQYAIVQIGHPDTGLDDALAAAAGDGRKFHDAEPPAVVMGMWPANVRVHFHRLQQAGGEATTTNDDAQWQAGPSDPVQVGDDPDPAKSSGRSVYTVDVPGPDQTNTLADVYHPIWDDLPAIFDGNDNCLNAADLDARAQLRVDDYYRLFQGKGGTRLWQRYSGLLEIAPGSTLKGVAWVAGMAGTPDEGVFTEIVRHPFLFYATGAGGGAGERPRWVERFEESGRLHSPRFRPTWPVYPEKFQILAVHHGPSPAGMYNCTVQRVVPPAGDPPTNLRATLDDNGHLQDGHQVTYVVTAVSPKGESLPSNEVKVLPASPQLTVVLDWDEVGGATSYNVYRGFVPGGENVLVASIDAESGTTFSDDGTQSLAPTVLPIGSGFLDAEPVWGFAFDDGGFSPGALVTARLVSYAVTPKVGPTLDDPATLQQGGNLVIGTQYYWVVTALFAGGESAISNEVTLTPTVGNQQASLAWTAVAGAVSYKVYRSTKSQMYTSSVVTIDAAEDGATEFVDEGGQGGGGGPSSPELDGRPLYVFTGDGGPADKVLSGVTCVGTGVQEQFTFTR
jgi:hypothetical protein